MKQKIKESEVGAPVLEKCTESSMKVPKKKKKIKIRLADPQIPDSYVCEIFDSSLENDDNDKKPDYIQPKNYFDVLMSKESRRSFNVISSVENELIPDETKTLRIVDSEEVINSRKAKKGKNREKLAKLVKQKKAVNGIGSDSSDDESLFQVQSKLINDVLKRRNSAINPNVTITTSTSGARDKCKNNCKESKENQQNNTEDEIIVDEIIVEESVKLTKPESKTVNILNYFSKVETPPKAKKPVVKLRKLKEIDMFKELKPQDSRRVKPPSIIESEDSEDETVIAVLKTKTKSKAALKQSVKLAPLFQKKPKVDPLVQKARLEFLQSGLPTSIKRTIETQKSQEAEQEVHYFPAVSHVQQRNDDVSWTLRNVIIPSLKHSHVDYVSNTSDKFHFTIKPDVAAANEPVKRCVEITEETLTSLRDKYNNINTDSIFKACMEKRDRHEEKLAELSKPSDHDDSVEVIGEDSNNETFNCVWTEKYKPKSSDILGNDQIVKKLGDWLKSWKEFDEEVKRLTKMGVRVKSKNSNGDSDDFVTSDEDSYGLRSPGNTCLLSGPCSSGKTSLVYSLASELEFNILEVNASSKRTGKKVLTELQEATQSHKVHHEVTETNNFFEKQNKKKQKKQKSRNSKTKKKRAEVNVENKCAAESQNNCKISLILIEDADVVFEEHDEGFVAAIMSLVQSSKRPVIFITSDPNCGHLERFKTQNCLMLKMFRPNLESSCATLDAISLLEGVSINKDVLESLVQQNAYDLRKCLLELQFWLQCGGGLTSVTKPLRLGQIWWGCNKFLFNSEIKHVIQTKAIKRKRINDLFDSSDEEEDGTAKKPKLETGKGEKILRVNAERDVPPNHSDLRAYAHMLDGLSLIDLLDSVTDDEPIPGSQYWPKDSLSLSENFEPSNWMNEELSNNLIRDIVDLSCRTFAMKNATTAKFQCLSPSWEEIRWRKQQNEARQELTSLVSLSSLKDARNLHLDYLPAIRTICRTEKHRFVSNTKRKNRFYHYLRTLGADPKDHNLEISCDVLKS